MTFVSGKLICHNLHDRHVNERAGRDSVEAALDEFRSRSGEILGEDGACRDAGRGRESEVKDGPLNGAIRQAAACERRSKRKGGGTLVGEDGTEQNQPAGDVGLQTHRRSRDKGVDPQDESQHVRRKTSGFGGMTYQAVESENQKEACAREHVSQGEVENLLQLSVGVGEGVDQSGTQKDPGRKAVGERDGAMAFRLSRQSERPLATKHGHSKQDQATNDLDAEKHRLTPVPPTVMMLFVDESLLQIYT